MSATGDVRGSDQRHQFRVVSGAFAKVAVQVDTRHLRKFQGDAFAPNNLSSFERAVLSSVRLSQRHFPEAHQVARAQLRNGAGKSTPMTCATCA